MEQKNRKIFDSWEQVDCENCEYWWRSSCDGVTRGSSKLCNSFLATRQTSIPLEIGRLRSALKWLKRGYWILASLVLLLWIAFGLWIRFGG